MSFFSIIASLNVYASLACQLKTPAPNSSPLPRLARCSSRVLWPMTLPAATTLTPNLGLPPAQTILESTRTAGFFWVLRRPRLFSRLEESKEPVEQALIKQWHKSNSSPRSAPCLQLSTTLLTLPSPRPSLTPSLLLNHISSSAQVSRAFASDTLSSPRSSSSSSPLPPTDSHAHTLLTDINRLSSLTSRLSLLSSPRSQNPRSSPGWSSFKTRLSRLAALHRSDPFAPSVLHDFDDVTTYLSRVFSSSSRARGLEGAAFSASAARSTMGVGVGAGMGVEEYRRLLFRSATAAPSSTRENSRDSFLGVRFSTLKGGNGNCRTNVEARIEALEATVKKWKSPTVLRQDKEEEAKRSKEMRDMDLVQSKSGPLAEMSRGDRERVDAALEDDGPGDESIAR